jgi:hypothetical protein
MAEDAIAMAAERPKTPRGRMPRDENTDCRQMTGATGRGRAGPRSEGRRERRNSGGRDRGCARHGGRGRLTKERGLKPPCHQILSSTTTSWAPTGASIVPDHRPGTGG